MNLGGRGRSRRVISDEVIELDRFTTADIPAHLAGEDEEQRRWFGFPASSTEESVREAFRRWDLDWARGGRTRGLAAREASSGDLVGGCEIRLRGDRVGQLSYWIFPRYRRRGYARRVVTLATRFAFDRLDVFRMEIYVEVANRASSAVAVRAGFLREGVLRSQSTIAGRRRDMVLYARLAGDEQEP